MSIASPATVVDQEQPAFHKIPLVATNPSRQQRYNIPKGPQSMPYMLTVSRPLSHKNNTNIEVLPASLRPHDKVH